MVSEGRDLPAICLISIVRYLSQPRYTENEIYLMATASNILLLASDSLRVFHVLQWME